MKEKMTIQELIVRIAEKSGASKKTVAEWLRVLPEIIESGLERDGEVRIAGLGTFKLKWVKARMARNLKTGASIEVPAHNKVVFYPEKGLKEKVNEDFRYLTYQVVEEEGETDGSRKPVPEDETVPAPSVVSQEEKADPLGKEEEVVREEAPIGPWDKVAEAEEEIPERRKRKTIYWVIPLVFVIIALLIVIFYMKNCQDELQFTDKGSSEQVIQPAETAPVSGDTQATEDTVTGGVTEEEISAPSSSEPQSQAPVQTGFPAQAYTTEPGKHLFQVAREIYGNPFLWALIYKENQSKIPDPENIISGVELVIPSLEGTPASLSRADSAHVAEGFEMLYEYYTSKGDERARDYRFAKIAYSPK